MKVLFYAILREMRKYVDICMRCPKRLLVTRNDQGKVSFYRCMEVNEYPDFVRRFHQNFLMHVLFALDRKTGHFLSPFEEFRDLFWRPLPYVERRRIRMGNARFLKMFDGQIDRCEMFAEMQLIEWNND